jgi:lipopolysaccharide transport system ATP-binding protein
MIGGMFSRPTEDKLAGEEFWALEDISFDVKPGETLGIIGRNGAGKSTTLKLLTRILKPTKGRSEVHGRVGALIELAAGFHPDLTGRENVFLQGAIMRMSRAETKRRFDEIVEFSGIGNFIDTPVKRYSSGMQARLGFSIAAHLDPEVLLIDEVLAVGDMSFQQKCFARLREYRQSGVAIAFVSHNMQAISTLCNRVLYLRPGAPPILSDVATAIGSYVSADARATDSRVQLVSATLTLRDSPDTVLGPISPGTWLEVSCTFIAGVDLPRCGFGLIVRRGDGLLVFQTGSSLNGVDPIDVVSGHEVSIKAVFRANLVRGTFTVAMALSDESRMWPIADLGVLGSFVVEETTRFEGVAELEPSFQMAVHR